ncbi:unnamed protein product [Protopolystoma xenopodis]|uniref:Uncharacterized protein n=1 Tax=Protopolystoma xenopodis TaxID=117903 RepID=A0A3S5CUB0_9PLAT|nr:unnamed protein product [Protopolystoma xenopodis]
MKEHQRLCRKMDTERSELAEYIAWIGHEINWKATERRAPYGDNTGKRKIREASDFVGETNLMNRRCLDQGSSANRRKSDHDEESGELRFSAVKRRCPFRKNQHKFRVLEVRELGRQISKLSKRNSAWSEMHTGTGAE